MQKTKSNIKFKTININNNNQKQKKMEAIKTQVTKVTSNPVGSVLGGVGAFYAAKKFGKVENKWALGAIALVGVVVGAMAQAKFKASQSTPTAATVKK